MRTFTLAASVLQTLVVIFAVWMNELFHFVVLFQIVIFFVSGAQSTFILFSIMQSDDIFSRRISIKESAYYLHKTHNQLEGAQRPT